MGETNAASTLRVALNLLWCAPGRVGGSEEYLTRQLHGVAALTAADRCQDLRIDVYASRAFAAAHRDLTKRFEVTGPSWSLDRQAVRILTEHTWLTAATRGADIVHHGGGTAPVYGPGPRVVTVHDLQYLRYPEYFSSARLRYLRSRVPRSVRGAAMVLVPSEYVRSRVIDAFAARPEQVRVVPHGFDPPDATATAVSPSELRTRYRIGDGPVLVYPAITHPHKNHALLLTAMARYWTDPDLRLVLLGGAGSAEAEVTEMVQDLGLATRVIRPGRVTAADRDGFIAMADAVVFPSRYEGFGAPLIEAMALGTPVVACDLTAVSEVVGSAGILLADDPEAWASVPALVVAQRAELVAAGTRRSAEFSLMTSAEALCAAYRITAEMTR
jgi:glycosyltransferase involved in cell wall biosynthesis